MPGTENRRLTKTTSLRLSETELVALRDAAAVRGVGPSALARVLVLKGIGRKASPRSRRRSDLAQAVAQTFGELGRWGNNLNQLAAHRNSGGSVDAPALAELAAAVERLTLALLALREVDP